MSRAITWGLIALFVCMALGLGFVPAVIVTVVAAVAGGLRCSYFH